MGQAFDEHGNVLGEAYGETRQEVFDKLKEQFRDAHEIRIRKLLEHEVRPLTDEKVDRFLANCEVTNPERLARIRKLFDEKWKRYDEARVPAVDSPAVEPSKPA